MKLSAVEALKNGLEDAFSATGLSLALAFSAVFGVSESLLSSTSFSHSYLLTGATGATVAVPLPDQALYLLYGVASLASVSLVVVGFRSFVLGKGLRETASELTAGSLAGRTVAVVLVGFLATGLVMVGSFFLLLPGIFVAVSLAFFPAIIAGGSERLGALGSSWELTSGNRFRVFALLTALLVLTSPLSFLLDFSGFGNTANLVAGVETTVGIAVLSSAFRQLTGGEPE